MHTIQAAYLKTAMANLLQPDCANCSPETLAQCTCAKGQGTPEFWACTLGIDAVSWLCSEEPFAPLQSSAGVMVGQLASMWHRFATTAVGGTLKSSVVFRATVLISKM